MSPPCASSEHHDAMIADRTHDNLHSAAARWLRLIRSAARTPICDISGDLTETYQASATADVRGSAPALTVPFATSTMMPALEFIDQGAFISTLWPLFDSSSLIEAGMRFSKERSPGYMVCGNGDAGKLRVLQRGASIAC